MTEEFDKEMSPADEYVQQGQPLSGPAQLNLHLLRVLMKCCPC